MGWVQGLVLIFGFRLDLDFVLILGFNGCQCRVSELRSPSLRQVKRVSVESIWNWGLI